MRRSLVSKATAKAAQNVRWADIRGHLIDDVCRGSGGQSHLGVLSLLRLEPEAQLRLDNAIEKAYTDLKFHQESRQGAPLLQIAKLSSLLDLRRRPLEASKLLKSVEKSSPPALQFLQHLVARHVAFEDIRGRRLLEQQPASRSEIGNIQVVESADKLHAKEVFDRFIYPGQPVVLRGSSCVPAWTPELLQRRIGSCQVPLRKCDPTSVEWAQLEPAGSATFSRFVEDATSGVQPHDGDRQLFDFSIWKHCGDSLVDEVKIPKWFCTDMYTYCSHHVQPVSGSTSPTLFLAPQGSRSSLHVDFLQTNFWMGLCHGRKRWRLVHRDDVSFLHPLCLTDLNPTFPFDLDSRFDSECSSSFPGVGSVRVLEIVLEPGDVIFVPRGWPHQVENLDTTVAVSANFIDASNVTESRLEALELGLVQEAPRIFLSGLDAAADTLDRLMGSMPDDHLSLRAFKSRHGEMRTPKETKQVIARVILVLVTSAVSTVMGLRWLREQKRFPAESSKEQ